MTMSNSIMHRVRARGRGAVFTARDFLGLPDASRASVDQALSRLARKGTIRRLDRGVYDFPLVSGIVGPVSPSPDVVARAVARGTGGMVLPSPARAANDLGLSTQVPAQSVYLTNGPSRQVRIGRQVVTLKHASPGNFVAADSPAGVIVQALRYVRSGGASAVVDSVKPRLSSDDRRALARDLPRAPVWMQRSLRDLSATG